MIVLKSDCGGQLNVNNYRLKLLRPDMLHLLPACGFLYPYPDSCRHRINAGIRYVCTGRRASSLTFD